MFFGNFVFKLFIYFNQFECIISIDVFKTTFFPFLISSIFFSINFSSAKSPRENWNYGKTGKEIKHHTEHVNINTKGLKINQKKVQFLDQDH